MFMLTKMPTIICRQGDIALLGQERLRGKKRKWTLIADTTGNGKQMLKDMGIKLDENTVLATFTALTSRVDKTLTKLRRQYRRQPVDKRLRLPQKVADSC